MSVLRLTQVVYKILHNRAIVILRSQSPPNFYYPNVLFQRNTDVSPSFFTKSAIKQQKVELTSHH
ncbi:hypothetical protein VP01_3078g2, partial [Puccinia sorghi]